MANKLVSFGRPAILAAALGLLSFGVAAAHAELRTIPLTILNHSGNGQSLFVYIKGLSNGKAVYVSGQEGQIEPLAPTRTPKSFALSLGKAERATMKLPQLQAGRIYFSFGEPVRVSVGGNGVPNAANGWVEEHPNYETLFDWVEFTWNPEADGNATFGANTTQVDMFGFPMEIRIAGLKSDYQTPVIMKSGFPGDARRLRRKIISTIRDAGPPWRELIVRPDDPLRVIAPNHGIRAGVFPEDQLRRYIDTVYRRYAAEDLVVKVAVKSGDKTASRPFHGTVSDGDLVFTDSQDEDVRYRYPKPGSLEVYKSGILPDPRPASGPALDQVLHITAMLQGAFLRSTILRQPNLDTCDQARFYEDDPVNVYAKAIHDHAIDKRAYAFGFDDTCDDSSVNIAKNPKSLRITLSPF